MASVRVMLLSSVLFFCNTTFFAADNGETKLVVGNTIDPKLVSILIYKDKLPEKNSFVAYKTQDEFKVGKVLNSEKENSNVLLFSQLSSIVPNHNLYKIFIFRSPLESEERREFSGESKPSSGDYVAFEGEMEKFYVGKIKQKVGDTSQYEVRTTSNGGNVFEFNKLRQLVSQENQFEQK